MLVRIRGVIVLVGRLLSHSIVWRIVIVVVFDWIVLGERRLHCQNWELFFLKEGVFFSVDLDSLAVLFPILNKKLLLELVAL